MDQRPNVIAKTMELLKESKRVYLHDLGFGNRFLDKTQSTINNNKKNR